MVEIYKSERPKQERYIPNLTMPEGMKARRTNEVLLAQGNLSERAIDGYTEDSVGNTAINMYKGEVRDKIFCIIATEIIRKNSEK